MPIYDYVCTACGARIEVVHGVSEAGPETCTVCGGRMRKALTSPAIVFKGSGWAKKDARSKPSGSSSATDKGSSATPEPSKPAAPEVSSGGD